MAVALTAERLREMLHYDPEKGAFRWVSAPGSRTDLVGREAGCPNADGYIQIRLDGVMHGAHRLAWLFIHGQWPADQVDHRNGVRDDNRIANLRPATNTQNTRHRTRPNQNNTSGYPGVDWHEASRGWRARICIDRRSVHLGSFPTPEEAHAVYLEAKRSHHAWESMARESRENHLDLGEYL